MHNKNLILSKIIKIEHIQPRKSSNMNQVSLLTRKDLRYTIRTSTYLDHLICMLKIIPLIYLYPSISYSYDLTGYSDYVFIHTVVFTTTKHCVISVQEFQTFSVYFY
jgi:hypothetical protein